MAAIRRLHKELADVKESCKAIFKEVTPTETNMYHWTGLILPTEPPFNKGAFRIEITFPIEFPFRPPKVIFRTRIYHPNVDEKGQICLPIVSSDHWKPATKIEQVIQVLVALIDHPEPDHALRAELAEEFRTNPKLFARRAEEFTKKFAERRPPD